MNYNGWYALDIFPYRENGVRAATESIKWIQGAQRLVEKMGRENIAQVIATGDALEASAMLREAIF
jgi:xylose isomerase